MLADAATVRRGSCAESFPGGSGQPWRWRRCRSCCWLSLRRRPRPRGPRRLRRLCSRDSTRALTSTRSPASRQTRRRRAATPRRRAWSARRSSCRSTARASCRARSRSTSRSCRAGTSTAAPCSSSPAARARARRTSSASATPAAVALYRYLFPGYTLVAYDDRGTGDSGLLDCPPLQPANTADTERAAAAACAASIGAPRDFYDGRLTPRTSTPSGSRSASTRSRSTASRTARSSRWRTRSRIRTTSSGCCSTRCCRPSCPTRTARTRSGPCRRRSTAFCSDGGCRSATSDFAGDVTTLANRLAAKPISVAVAEPNGTKKRCSVDGLELLSMVIDADLNPGLAAELPAVVRAALRGRTQPLARLVRSGHDAEQARRRRSTSASRCTPRPSAGTARSRGRPTRRSPTRAALEQSAIAALPPGTFGPFGSWAAQLGNADFCLGLAEPGRRRSARDGPSPERAHARGERRLRPADADRRRSVSRRALPAGKLLVVPGVGHSTLTADYSGCAVARRPHLDDRRRSRRATCPRPQPLVAPRAGPAGAARTAPPGIARRHTRDRDGDAEGSRGGVAHDRRPHRLDDARGRHLRRPADLARRAARSSSPATRSRKASSLSGTLKIAKGGPPLQFEGLLTVSGPRARDRRPRPEGRLAPRDARRQARRLAGRRPATSP